jgi:hypothetical protein
MIQENKHETEESKSFNTLHVQLHSQNIGIICNTQDRIWSTVEMGKLQPAKIQSEGLWYSYIINTIVCQFLMPHTQYTESTVIEK